MKHIEKCYVKINWPNPTARDAKKNETCLCVTHVAHLLDGNIDPVCAHATVTDPENTDVRPSDILVTRNPQLTPRVLSLSGCLIVFWNRNISKYHEIPHCSIQVPNRTGELWELTRTSPHGSTSFMKGFYILPPSCAKTSLSTKHRPGRVTFAKLAAGQFCGESKKNKGASPRLLPQL